MRVHLINPSDTAFGTAVITPRWLFVLAAATPPGFDDPVLCDETVRHLDLESLQRGDVVGIGIHTGNALRGYALGASPNSAVRPSSLAAFTPAFIRRNPSNMARRIA